MARRDSAFILDRQEPYELRLHRGYCEKVCKQTL